MKARGLATLGIPTIFALCVLAISPTMVDAASVPPTTDVNAAHDGDFLVWSIPLTQAFVDPTYPTVKSGPGHIKDGIVVYTGAGGTDVNTNLPGMDDAFSAPGGKCNGTAGDADCNFPAMGGQVLTPLIGAPSVGDPNGTGNFGPAGTDIDQSWDSTMAAFLGFLNGDTPLFFFNQNQSNASGDPASNFCAAFGGGFSSFGVTTNQDICVYARVILTNASGPSVTDRVFELEGPTRLFSQGPAPTNGVFNGAPLEPGEVLLAKGDVCLDSGGAEQLCDGSEAFGPINHNLGADNAAYMAQSPGLNAALALCQAAAPGCLWNTIRIQFLVTDLSNGFEQLFLTTTEQLSILLPEPTSLLLLGAGLIGLGARAWRRRRSA